jgi:hypothetical protein
MAGKNTTRTGVRVSTKKDGTRSVKVVQTKKATGVTSKILKAVTGK